MMLLRFGIQRLFAEAPRKDCRLGLRSQGVAHHRIDHRNGTAVTTRTAIQSAPKAAPPAGEIPDLGLGADNGTRYGGREFKKAVQMLGIRHAFIWKHTPEQNGHVESFRGTPRKERARPHDFARFQNAEVILARALADCNGNRIHSARGCLTPGGLACELGGGNK